MVNATLPGNFVGGGVLPGPTAVSCILYTRPYYVQQTPNPTGAHPILWQVHLPINISDSIVLWNNPNGEVTNNDLYLTSIILHNIFMAYCYVIRERTALTQTYSIDVLCWSRKGSTIFNPHNGISNNPSISTDLTNTYLLAYTDHTFPHRLTQRWWKPPSAIASIIYSTI